MSASLQSHLARKQRQKSSSDYENVRLQRDAVTLDALADGCTLALLTRQR